MMTRDLTGLVVDTVLGLRPEELSRAARQTAKFALLDLLACAVAGTEDDCARITANWVLDMEGRPESTLIGTAYRAPAALAALANATAGHALDFDDVSLTMIHPSTTVVPALLAVAETGRYSGQELLAAYAAGFEVQARLCRVLNPEHYGRGWHTTQTVGVLACAAAVAKLIGLDAEQTRLALGIAASSASGLRKNFGSMVKPLHAGQAAMHGVQAAQLAQRGFTADREIFDGRNGYLQVFAIPEAPERLAAAFAPGAELELETSGVGIKRFACCGAIHTALDAMEKLTADGTVTPRTVTRIECRVNPMTPNILVHSNAKDGTEGKFSMEYSLAVYLLERKAGLAQYSVPAPLDAELVRLMKLVDVVVDQTIPVNLAFFPTVVTVELAGGSRRSLRVDSQHGYPGDPLSLAELTEKVTDCCTPALPPSAIQRLVATVMELESLPDAGQLARLVATGEES